MKVVYIVLNWGDYLKQAYCSIISYLHFHPDQGKNIVLFTDEDTSDIDLPIEIISISSLKFIAKESDHILIKRIQIIKRCIKKYKKDVLCVDTDTIFFKPLWFESISAWNSFVHMYESPVQSYKWGAFWKSFDITYGEYTKSIWKTDMYNVSTLWISMWNIDMLDEIADITDTIYKITWEWTSDQVAFSYVLSTTKITYLYDRIFHYRAYKAQTTQYIFNALWQSYDYQLSSRLFSAFINHFSFGCLQFIEKTWDHIIDYFKEKPDEYNKLLKIMSNKSQI